MSVTDCNMRAWMPFLVLKCAPDAQATVVAILDAALRDQVRMLWVHLQFLLMRMPTRGFISCTRTLHCGEPLDEVAVLCVCEFAGSDHRAGCFCGSRACCPARQGQAVHSSLRVM